MAWFDIFFFVDLFFFVSAKTSLPISLILSLRPRVKDVCFVLFIFQGEKSQTMLKPYVDQSFIDSCADRVRNPSCSSALSNHVVVWLDSEIFSGDG